MTDHNTQRPGLDEFDLEAMREGSAIKKGFRRAGERKKYKTPKEFVLPAGEYYDDLARRNVIDGKEGGR